MSSVVIQDRVDALATGATTANVLAGKEAEFIFKPAMIQLLACASNDAVTAAAFNVFCTLTVGGRVVIDDQQVNGRAYGTPIDPDDVMGGAVVVGRMILKFRNASGANCDVGYKLNIAPV